MIRSGLAFFSCRQPPSCENTFSCAFSRTEQVLSSSRSAWAGSSVSSYPSASRSTSTMRAESYSFIWQPKVRIKTRGMGYDGRANAGYEGGQG